MKTRITVTEVILDDGTIALKFDVRVLGEGDIGDMRALFFDLQNTDVAAESLIAQQYLGGLESYGYDVTDIASDEGEIATLGQDANIRGDVINELGEFDVGVEIGTPGSSTDDIQETTFLLTSVDDTDLTLDMIDFTDFGIRYTSVGQRGGDRNGAEKTGGLSNGVAQVDALTVLENDTASVDLIANDSLDSNGDLTVDPGEEARVTQVYLDTRGTVSGTLFYSADLDAFVGVVSDDGLELGTLTVAADGALSFALDGADADQLAEGETRTVAGSYTTVVLDPNGFESLATAQFEITAVGLNDAPTIEDTTVIAGPDGSAVFDLSQIADDADAGENGGTLVYSIVSQPSGGTATIEGSTLIFEPGDDFLDLAVGETRDVTIVVSASDGSAGAPVAAFSLAVSTQAAADEGSGSTGEITITVTGENDAPTLAPGALSATEDGGAETLDLSLLGDDVDSDDTGDSLTYSILIQPAEGSASITGTTLSFDPGAGFQDLAEGETRDVAVTILATDTHGLTAVNDVIVTVTGVDEPTGDPVYGYAISGYAETSSLGRNSISVGDANGDGFDDFLLGSQDATGAAQAIMIYGDAAGLDGIDLEQLSPEDGVVLSGGPAGPIASLGDINADGLDDFLLASFQASPFGRTNAGEAYVIYGSAAGLENVDINNMSSTEGFTIQGANAGDRLGIDASSGDFNGDGYTDIAIGAYTATRNGGYADGEAYIIYGGPGGFGGDIDLSTLASDEGTIIAGTVGLQYVGARIENLGDVDNDGIDDLYVGSLEDGVAGYILFGSNAPLSEMSVDQIENGTGITLFSPDPTRNINEVAAVGDVNGDGQTDFLAGLTNIGPNFEGRAYLIYGGVSGDIDLGALSPAQGTVFTGVSEFAFTGGTVSSAGDINGDGLADFLIGASEANGTGEAYLIFGSATGYDPSVDLGALTPSQGFTFVGYRPGDQTGAGISAAGDVDGNGYDDLLVSSPGKTVDSQYAAGETYVILGGSDNLAAFDAHDGAEDGRIGLGYFTTPAPSASSFGATILGMYVDQYDRLISVETAGDVDGDGIGDALISSLGGFLVYGGAISDGYEIYAPFNPDSATEIVTGPVDARGLTVTGAGDVNADGFEDVLIGGASQYGEAYIVYGRDGGFAQPIDLYNLAPGDSTQIGGFYASDPYLWSADGVGDVNGDGIDDIVISGTDNSGRSYVIFGNEFGLPDVIDVQIMLPDQGADLGGWGGVYDGFSVSSAGDFNGDGIQDILTAGIGQGGQSVVQFGDPSGQFFNWAFIDGYDFTTGYIPLSANGVGDVNGDGFDDLAFANAGHEGEAVVVFGNDFANAMDLDNIGGPDGFRITGFQNGSSGLSGARIDSAGDLNNDGIDDIVIAAADIADFGGYLQEVPVFHVIYGTAGGPLSDIDLTALTPDQGMTIRSSDQFDFGGADASGGEDLNGDGVDDLLLATADRSSPEGTGFVVYGGLLDAFDASDGSVDGVIDLVNIDQNPALWL